MAKKTSKRSSSGISFFERLSDPQSLLELFEHLPGIYMYIKDTDSRYVRANRVVCEVVGVSSQAELIGKTDFDFFPPAIAAQYHAEDRRVIESGRELTEQVWLVPGNNGVPRWYLCNKVPLHDKNGEVIGIAGVKRPYEYSESESTGYSRLLKVVALVTNEYQRPLGVDDLAESAGLSVSQLQREFSRLFGVTPIRYLREVRIGVAKHLLQTSDKAIANIASDCGFYDQSHFNRHFKSSTGLTPGQYRQRFQPSANVKRHGPTATSNTE